MLTLDICISQPRTSAGRRFAASRSPLITTNDLFRFHNNKSDEIPCKQDSTEYARSFLKNLPVGLGCVETDVRI